MGIKQFQRLEYVPIYGAEENQKMQNYVLIYRHVKKFVRGVNTSKKYIISKTWANMYTFNAHINSPRTNWGKKRTAKKKKESNFLLKIRVKK